MKKPILAALILALAFPAGAFAAAADTTKAAPPAGTVPMTMKEVKQKLGIVVFPAKGQKPEVQDQEEYECLMWGAEQAGIKPGQQAPDAKAALLAFDRLGEAWLHLAELGAINLFEAAPVLTELQHLTTSLDRLFPRARSFVRPGFDEPAAVALLEWSERG